jgi:hypothetical protein
MPRMRDSGLTRASRSSAVTDGRPTDRPLAMPVRGPIGENPDGSVRLRQEAADLWSAGGSASEGSICRT